GDQARLRVVDAVVEAAQHVARLLARGDRHAVVCLLPGERDVVAGGAEVEERELALVELELLHAHHVGAAVGEPGQHALLPRADRVDVPGGEFHGCALYSIWRRTAASCYGRRA